MKNLLLIAAISLISFSVAQASELEDLAAEKCAPLNIQYEAASHLKSAFDACQAFIMFNLLDLTANENRTIPDFGSNLDKVIKGSSKRMNSAYAHQEIGLMMLSKGYSSLDSRCPNYPVHMSNSLSKGDFSLLDFSVTSGVCFKKF